MTISFPSPAVTRPTSQTRRGGRIVGVDLARAVAMFGMVIAHYAWSDDTGGLLDGIASSVDGRAMPLFVLLGGVGVTILAQRSPEPDVALAIRAAILFPAGLLLQEATTFIAIILHYYSVFFLAAVGLRRLPSRVLLGLAVAIAAFGSWSYQVVAPQLGAYRDPLDLITNPGDVISSLLIEGFYPFFPVASFFIVGMLIGRLDLRSPATALRLLGFGSLVTVIVLLVADPLVAAAGVDTAQWELDSTQFDAWRLLDDDGHSEMAAWVVSATGSALAVVGASLLVGARFGRPLWPFVALGQLALSFYVFQAVLVRFTPHPQETELGAEFLTALAIYFGFMVFAVAWRWRFRSGPLEALLRLGSSTRLQLPKSFRRDSRAG